MLDMDAVKAQLNGPAALVSTIFKDDYSLDTQAIERNVRFMAEHGLGKRSGFLIAPCGDGEYTALSPEEHTAVVTAAVRGADGTIPVVAGVAATDYRLAATLAQRARAAGAVGIMCPPPFYYPLNEDAIVDWYDRLAKSVDIGIMVYDQSWRGQFINACITVRCMERLVAIRNVISMKHSGLGQLIDEFTILNRYHERIAYIDSSAGYTATTAHMHGAAGFITGIAPWWPEYELRYWELLQAGKYLEAERYHSRLYPFVARFHRGAETDTHGGLSSKTVLKAALEYVGLTGGTVRPPFRGLNQAERDEVFRFLAAADVPRPLLQTV
ncbi:MAG TPA: dihydrodipicolinate synthase family protein [bacterium]|nr:dihydrodipicolinate synthase family protein [bacterium]